MATAYVNQTPIVDQIYEPTLGVIYAPFACNIASLKASFAGFVINDSVNLVDIPNMSMLVDWYIDICSTDSNVSPATVASLGDSAADATHGAAGAGGFATAIACGRGVRNTYRPGGYFISTGATPAFIAGQWVAGALPWIYSIPFANLPTNTVLPPGPLGAVSLMIKFTTAPATTTTTGTIYGWVAYTLLGPLHNPSGSGGVKPL